MLDIKFIRENLDLVKKGLGAKANKFALDAFIKLDDQRRQSLKEIENLRAQQNKINDEVSYLIKEKKDPKAKINQTKDISSKLKKLEEQFKEIKKNFQLQALRIPNVAHVSVPVGNESKNKIVKTKGEPAKFSFKPLDHIALAEHLDIIDFRRAAKLAGSNFVLFKGDGALLERVLINFMLDIHTNNHNYQEVFPPFLANRAAMTITAQLPNLEEDMYKLAEDDYFLIPTAEVPLTNMHANETLSEDELPIRYTAYTACFRKEAGSYGKDTRGLMRVHEFDKVELVKFVKPEGSYNELEKLLIDACKVLELLELPYRVNLLSTEEISFAATKCYDIEIYAPGIDKWLEVSSCSNFEDFQARRGNIRYRDKKTNKLNFVHTLNGSGVALARLVIAILENYQQKDGSILIPKVLSKYFDGRERITK